MKKVSGFLTQILEKQTGSAQAHYKTETHTNQQSPKHTRGGVEQSHLTKYERTHPKDYYQSQQP